MMMIIFQYSLMIFRVLTNLWNGVEKIKTGFSEDLGHIHFHGQHSYDKWTWRNMLFFCGIWIIIIRTPNCTRANYKATRVASEKILNYKVDEINWYIFTIRNNLSQCTEIYIVTSAPAWSVYLYSWPASTCLTSCPATTEAAIMTERRWAMSAPGSGHSGTGRYRLPQPVSLLTLLNITCHLHTLHCVICNYKL